MKFSIILPTYNRAYLLPMCLDALIVQNYPKSNFEIVVVDNNSKDNTKEVIENYIKIHSDTSIKYILEKQQGLVFARHSGAINSTNEILVFTDDDGTFNKDWLKEVAKVFEQEPETTAVASKIVIKWDKEPPAWVIPYEWLLGKLDYGDKVLFKKGIYINGGSFTIRKDVLFKLKGFNPGPVGDWQTGDDEDTLNQRLWDGDYLLAYTPHAIMEHHQLVAKNAKVIDIKRRYINIGISTPYRIFKNPRKGNLSLIINLLKCTKSIIKNQVKRIYYIIKKDKEKKLLATFTISYHYSQFPYTYKLIFNKEFRQYLKNEGWVLN
jgi:glucosyl-dolichyl phosphate glucuronosyltransferase